MPAPATLFHMIAGAPDPVAPFSHATEVDGWVFVTGQMPTAGTALDSGYPEGIEAQTHHVMRNLTQALHGCDLGLRDVVSARVFLMHFKADYEAMNATYASYFEPGRRPARTGVGVTVLCAEGPEVSCAAMRLGRRMSLQGRFRQFA